MNSPHMKDRESCCCSPRVPCAMPVWHQGVHVLLVRIAMCIGRRSIDQWLQNGTGLDSIIYLEC